MMGEIADLKKVYGLLEDDESRHIYRNRLNWLMTGDDAYLDEVVDLYLPALAPSMPRRIADWLDSIRKDYKVIVYGVGKRTRQFSYLFKDHLGDRLIGFCDGDTEKQGIFYMGLPIMAPEKLKEYDPVSIAVMPVWGHQQITNVLFSQGVLIDNIYYSPFSGFDDSENQYFDDELVKYGDNEIFMDLGSMDLKTSYQMKKHCPLVKKIYALEPDANNFENCKKSRLDFGDTKIELKPYGAWSEDTILRLQTVLGRPDASAINNVCGDSEVEVRAIDNIVKEDEIITFIKADIEGAELEMLKGAAKTIKRCKPKLAICIYHKPEDLTEIPLYIKKLASEYKLYVRLYGNDFTETVLYAIPPEI